MEWLKELFVEHSALQAVVVVSLISTIGIGLGKIRFFGISLGTAFIFFVGILAGHFGLSLDPAMLTYAESFGLVIFVYALGLQVVLAVCRGSSAQIRADQGDLADHQKAVALPSVGWKWIRSGSLTRRRPTIAPKGSTPETRKAPKGTCTTVVVPRTGISRPSRCNTRSEFRTRSWRAGCRRPEVAA